jgi:hypothetical protein
VERGQHRAGAAAPSPFFFCHGENPATKSVAPEVLRQKKSLDRRRTAGQGWCASLARRSIASLRRIPITSYVIPGGMYPGNPDGIPTIGTQAVLVTSSNQPDELCYAVVKAVFENFADFRRLHPALSTLEIKDMVPSGSVIPIHPGALNYYREAGLSH